MALNKNHEFAELDGVKCGIVEKEVLSERVAFLKELLEFNRFTVVVESSPPPKKAPKPAADTEETETSAAVPPPPETFTVGVTDYTFNPINAIFGRQLKTKNGHIVTLAYWQQKENESHD
ncbi:MAG TPA: hypothetical protein PKW62_11020, partial [Chitinophagaceae bacterium]|nr:hypothetical protein [Chitinophagaceae bacterium]